MNVFVLTLSIVVNILLLLPSLAKADSGDVEQEFYDGMGSSGWSYDYEDEDEDQKPARVVKKHVKLDLKSSPNEFFGADNIPVVDEQVSRSDLEDKIKKNVKQ